VCELEGEGVITFPIMWTKLKVADVKCVDDSSQTRGVHIACGDDGRSIVTLIFDKSISHKQTDDLMHLLEKMKLTDVIMDTP
jgi:ammonia channel protein AmtB